MTEAYHKWNIHGIYEKQCKKYNNINWKTIKELNQMKKIFIFLIILYTSCISTQTNAQMLRGATSNETIDYTDNIQITTDLFPKTSHYMHDLNMKLIYALKPALDEYKKEKISSTILLASSFILSP